MSYLKKNSEYAKGVLITISDCVSADQEAAYNEWYEKVLIPKIQELDFIGDAYRYTNVQADTPLFAGRPKYLALFDINAEDMYKAFEAIRAKEDELKAEGKYFEGHVPVYNTVYERFVEPYMTPGKIPENPVEGVYIVMNYCADPAKEDEFNDWYTNKHCPDTCKCGNWDTANRYILVDPAHPTYHQPPYLSIYETTKDPLVARLTQTSQRWMWKDDKIWEEVLQLNYTGAFRHLSSFEK